MVFSCIPDYSPFNAHVKTLSSKKKVSHENSEHFLFSKKKNSAKYKT